MTNEVVTVSANHGYVFSSGGSFEIAQRMATALSKSDLVPTQYKGNMPNCLLALEMSQRMQASPLMVMQNLHIIHGRPSFGSAFLTASLNSTGRFSPLRYVVEGEGDDKSCYAWATDKTGEVLKGPKVSMKMARAEGWIDKNGSKWKTMPELMMHYRAAAFFVRTYAPEVTMGMPTREEIEDTGGEIIDVTPTTSNLATAEELTKEFVEQPAIQAEVVAPAPTEEQKIPTFARKKETANV